MKKRIVAIAMCIAVIMSIMPLSLTVSAAPVASTPGADTAVDVFKVPSSTAEKNWLSGYAYDKTNVGMQLSNSSSDLLENTTRRLYVRDVDGEDMLELVWPSTATRLWTGGGEKQANLYFLPAHTLFNDAYPNKAAAEKDIGEYYSDAADYNFLAFRIRVRGAAKTQSTELVIQGLDSDSTLTTINENDGNYNGGALINLNTREVTALGEVKRVRLAPNFNGWVVLPKTAIRGEGKTIADIDRVVFSFKSNAETVKWNGTKVYIGNMKMLKNLDTFKTHYLDCRNSGHYVVANAPVAPTCTEDGYTPYKCMYCPETVRKDFVAARGSHDFGTATNVPASCEEGSYTKRVCKDCGYIEKTNVQNNATGHVNIIIDENVGATCHTDGYVYKQCACGEILVNTITPMTFTPIVEGAVKATCKNPGNTGKHTCGNPACGVVFDEGTVIPQKKHTEKIVNAVEATCKKEGYTGDKICSVCQTPISKGEKIAKLTTHKYGDWKITVNATTDKNGSQERVCSVCKKVETKVILATGTGTGGNGANGGANGGADIYSPSTGESNNAPFVWAAIFAVSLGAVAVVGISKKRRLNK